MSDVLTVHTHFEDISELAQGLADRVDENQIILYGPESYEEGAELAFQVLLADGTPGLEGSGFVTATYDGGEDRDPDTRYDVVIAGLRLEGMSEVVFERLMVARASLVGDEPPSTEMAVPEGLAEAVAAEEAVEEVAEVAELAEPVEEPVEAVAAEEVAEVEDVAPAPSGFDDEATTVASAADFFAEASEPEPEPVSAEEVAEIAEPEPVRATPVEAAPAPEPAPAVVPAAAPAPVEAPAPAARPQAREIPAAVEVAPIAGGGRNVGATGEGFRGLPPPNAPPVPPGFTVQKDLDSDQLARPALASAWQPEARPAEPSGPSDGSFQYGGPIPIPNRPPRPELTEAQRVSKAPSPTTEDAYRNLRASLGFTVPAPATAPVAVSAPASVAMAAAVEEPIAEPAPSDVADDVVDEVEDVEDAVDLDPAEG